MRLVGTVMLAALLAALGEPRQEAVPAVRLSTIPGQVYKSADPGSSPTESWSFHLVVSDGERRPLVPLGAEVELLNAGGLVERRVLPSPMLEGLRRTSFRVDARTPPDSPRHLFPVDEVFDLRLAFTSFRAADVTRTIVRLRLGAPGSAEIERTLEVPLAAYAQKTKLAFPFRGKGVITQGPVNDAGHSAFHNQYAIDVVGVTGSYAPLLSEADTNEAYAGWNRDVLAPADGVVTYARNDVPNNPKPGLVDRALFRALASPAEALAGNGVIIDHGSSEFSVLLHLQPGSVPVTAGDRVRQGDVVGRIGSSGEASGPHLHYHLQDGPAVFRHTSLPVRFENVTEPRLFRGTFFTVK